MSAAAIASALLPQGQGGAAPPSATQGALAVLDTVFGAILKGVDSEDAGSQIPARGFGASETKGDSSLPQSQGSAVTASASSPTATFKASLAALSYEAMAGSDGSSGISSQAQPSPFQTLTATTGSAQSSQADRATSPRIWTTTASPGQTDLQPARLSRTIANQTNASPTPIADANSSGANTRSTWTRSTAPIEIGQTVASAANAAASPLNGGAVHGSIKTRSSETRNQASKIAATGQTVASAANSAGDGTTAANAAASPLDGDAVHGSAKTRSPETRNEASTIAATGQDVSNAAPAVGAQLNPSQTASIWPQFSASATSSASPSQGSGSDAANNQTKAPVLELGQKFWTWPECDASDADASGEPLGSVRGDTAQ